jgi:hypothetical protein
MKQKFNTDQIFIQDEYEVSCFKTNLSLEQAIDIIQRNERGRQACETVQKMTRRDRESYFSRKYDMEARRYASAAMIQRVFRGYLGRKIVTSEREKEYQFLGMSMRANKIEILKQEEYVYHIKRMQEQVERKEEYQTVLTEIKSSILEEEGILYQNRLRDERMKWLTDQIAQGKFPTNLDEFYEEQNKSISEEKHSSGKNDKKDSKKVLGEKIREDKPSSSEGLKKSKDDEANLLIAMPKLETKTALTQDMLKTVEEFKQVWNNREDNSSINFEQYSSNMESGFNRNLARDIVRPDVYDDLRKQLDDMLILTLAKLQMQLAPISKKKNKMNKTKKSKKVKGTKKKLLPGDKIADLRGLDTSQMLSLLIDSKLVVRCRNKSLKDFVGDFNYLGSLYHDSDRKGQMAWEPEDPSYSQIRQMLVEYCILPNGSPTIKSTIEPDDLVKSIMFYGPAGTGKTLAVEIVANELGALLIHVTPEKLKGLFPGKSGPAILVHMIMMVARDPVMQPVVIYLDECEKYFTTGKKGKDRDGPSRYKKDLMLYKKLALTNEHRCIIIGTTNVPEDGDVKEMKAFFDKFAYFPYPNYTSRLAIWKHCLEERVRESAAGRGLGENPRGPQTNAILGGDLSTLARVSEGYSAGAIVRATRAATRRHSSVIGFEPVHALDLIDHLSLQTVTYRDDREVFMRFVKTITGLEERRKRVEALLIEDANKKPEKSLQKSS